MHVLYLKRLAYVVDIDIGRERSGVGVNGLWKGGGFGGGMDVMGGLGKENGVGGLRCGFCWGWLGSLFVLFVFAGVE